MLNIISLICFFFIEKNEKKKSQILVSNDPVIELFSHYFNKKLIY